MNLLLTCGTFDFLHANHLVFLRQCKKLASRIVVSLNTDEFVKRFKGFTPIIPYEERRDMLLGCRYVDEVVENTDGEDSKPVILSVKPSILAIGDDWAKKDYYKQMNFTQEWLDENDILLCYIPYKTGVSSTILKQRILAQ